MVEAEGLEMMVAIVRGGGTADQTVGARAAVLNEFLL